jgi:hypothetical protein
MNMNHNYDMLRQDLVAQKEQAIADRTEKSEIKAKALEAKASAEGDLEDTTITMEADKKYLADLTAACERKAADLESRQQLRSEELEAIVKAIEIISSPAVKGNAEKHLPTLLQKGASLASLCVDTSVKNQAKVVMYLRQKARN